MRGGLHHPLPTGTVVLCGPLALVREERQAAARCWVEDLDVFLVEAQEGHGVRPLDSCCIYIPNEMIRHDSSEIEKLVA